jgi:PAS domain S-box-containing protein
MCNREDDEVIDTQTYEAILNSIDSPIVFVDNDHVIRYLNKSARTQYCEKQGYPDLIGRSLFDCHNSESRMQIRELHGRLERGENEIFLEVNKDGEKVSLVAVRNVQGELLGYYERFEGGRLAEH